MVKKELNNIEVLDPETEGLAGRVNAERLRTIMFQCEVTYNAQATAGIQVNAYHQISDNEDDTVPYDWYTLTFAAGTTVRESYLFSAPEDGQIIFKVENLDDTVTATNIRTKVTMGYWNQGITGEPVL